MNSQIFKKEIPFEIVTDFLSKNCLMTKSFFVFNIDAFKKAQYNDSLKQFLTECESYYHVSKKAKYLTKETYNAVVTIIRQIYNFHKIPFSSKIKYAHSSYTIEYYFFSEQNKISQLIN